MNKDKPSTLVMKLKTAGTEIYAHPSQAEELKPLEPLVVYTEDASNRAVITEGQPLTREEIEHAEAAIKAAEAEVKELEMEAEEMELEEEGGKKSRTSQAAKAKAKVAKAKKAAEGPSLSSKFIKFIDLMPPLPKKGTFEVQDIKASPYFFS